MKQSFEITITTAQKKTNKNNNNYTAKQTEQ